MRNINPEKVMYVKLGAGGNFEKGCIDSGIIKLDYHEVNHELCASGQWDLVEQQISKKDKPDHGAAKRHIQQIRSFYECGKQTLWITFYANKLWWCFSDNKIKVNQDGTKQRTVIDKWHDCDINNNVLFISNISGKITKTQGYMGTICEIKEDEREYLVKKINSMPTDEVVRAMTYLSDLRKALEPLIQSLTWGDFEILIDLIFRQAGWQRVSSTGETQKTLDLDLYMPISKRRAMVQIKSQSSLSTFKEYDEKFSIEKEYDEFYYFVHSPDKSLKDAKASYNNYKTKIIFVDEISDLCISAGLVDWLIERTS